VSLVARLSPRSARRFARFRSFTGPIFGLLDAVYVQEPEEKHIWENLGARAGAIHCTGSIKYDEPPAKGALREDLVAVLRKTNTAATSLILLAGSTFPGEEVILARVFLKLRTVFPDLFLVLVPRHVERTPEIVAELTPLPLQIALRTESEPKEADVLIVNTTGELRDWYRCATVVFIGKSLTSTGGQNPVEPVLLGKPVVFGPRMENFAPIVRSWLQNDAAIQVADESELAAQVERLLKDPELRERLAAKALDAISRHFGATERVINHLTTL
jgi:3-deoxy-D-manno-octulosonic-acid transferase